VDLRDLYRPGSGLTLRRLLVMVRALPADATVWAAKAKAEEQAEELAKVAKLRERQDYYRWRRK
jgi:hypothetical protein